MASSRHSRNGFILFQGKTEGPKPSWVVMDPQGKIQHARTVLTMDENAEKAMLELEESPETPKRRIVGKQPPQDEHKVQPPRLMVPREEREEVAEDPESPQDQPLPPPGAELDALQFREGSSFVGRGGVTHNTADPGQAQTHAGRSSEEEQTKDDHCVGCDRADPGGLDSRWEEQRRGADEDDHSVTPASRPGEQLLRSNGRFASLQAGGESISATSTSISATSTSTSPMLRATMQHKKGQRCGLKKCRGCGLLQEAEVKRCQMCEAGWETKMPSDGPKGWNLEITLEDYQGLLEEEYRGWNNVLRSTTKEVPEDETQGSVQGSLVEETSERLEEIALELDKVAKGNQVRDRQRCALAALSLVEENPGAGAVLHTHTVGLAEVRRDLALWREALQQEYDSLTKITGAVKPIDKKELKGRTDLEFAPGKLVATVKAPNGRRKARVVVCGNMVEPSLDEQQAEIAAEAEGDSNQGSRGSTYRTRAKGYEHYASGTDGTVIRAVLRKAAEERWQGATVDVRTAFLLAPRKGGGETLIVRPPRILLEAGIIGESELWRVDKAL